ncbi:hypothetical protein F0562_002139 [Nyssa sinensis]|uniref:Late embryogenesis abundant protein LEA-2 subgroup domain-containing protein n=1 Tax=Nyssa sinensis TaxID=561372 RepID=A0A5J5C533_9ASTE|nr:hypothetical protein F0562_002139 [Nyssa sinensis]
MADFALPRTSSVRKPPLGRPPSCQNLQRNSSRRVSFSDFTSKEDQISIQSSDDEEESGWKCCHSCCAWTSLAVGCVVFLVLLLAGSFFSYLQSNLPEVQIQRLNISKIGAVSSNKQTLLDADVELKFNATNKNDIVLEYGKLKMDISLDGIKMGEGNIAAFTQKPHNSTMLNIRSKVTKEAVVKDDVKDLKSNYNTSQLVIDVVMKGTLGFHVSGRELNGFPLTIKCLQIDQSAIDSGLRPDCSVRILPFSLTD